MLNLATGVSIILYLATILLWVRSHWAYETIGWLANRWSNDECRTQAYGITWDSGGLMFFTMRRVTVPPISLNFREANPALSQPYHTTQDAIGYPYMNDYDGVSGFGFGIFSGERLHDPHRDGLAHDDFFLVIPFWFLFLLTVTLPCLRGLALWRRLEAIRNGCCQTCGYDLRATPDRCPECGAPAPSLSPVVK